MGRSSTAASSTAASSKAASVSQREVALLRLVAQRLAGPPLASAGAAVGWLTALQAQDLPGALTSVALRTDGGSRADVEAALRTGEIVRSWPMRGTLHLVRGEDLPWMLELLASRAVAKAARRRAQLELDETTVERARELAAAALSGGGELTRAELLAAWQAGGVDTSAQRGYHLLGHLAQTGTLCLGPRRDGEQLIVLLAEWVPQPRQPSREEALGELAARFFRSHGPATVPDLIRWGQLTAGDARAALDTARPQLESITVDGVEHLLDPETPQLLSSARRRARGVFLLPGFDELVLGYADRRAVLSPEHAGKVVPGGNGVFRPTVVSDGRIVGTWRHAGRGAARTVSATAFEGELPAQVATAVRRAYAALP